jgi:glycosyltransferase involved in cell wall biosynthesis
VKIGYVVSRFPQLSESFVLREIDQLEREGVEVVLCPLLRQDEPVRHPAAARWVERAWYSPFVSRELLRDAGRYLLQQPRAVARAYGASFSRVATTPNFLIGTAGISLKALHLARRLEQAGVGHVHAHFATHPATAAWLIHRVAGIGYSFTAHAHDIYVHTAMLREKLAEARFVATISTYNRDLLARYGDVSKVHVVHSGVDLALYPFRLPHRGRPFRIMSVASLQPYKGLDNLVRACALLGRGRMPPFTCDIVGSGELEGELRRLVDSLGLEGVVRLLGPRAEEDVRGLLFSADLFVLPSVVTRSGKKEGLPVVLIEALATGVPAVATAISGVPEIVRHGETGLLVPPGNVEALAASIQEVAEDPAGAAARAQRGRALVESEFRLDVNVRKLVKLFRDAVRE